MTATPQVPGTRPANRLADATSPYLLQHAHNPVDWYPWGPEAWERAVRENRPVFLSIGYSACHWCHVMEREVFENPQIAELMNREFINIKVDREERPDLDEIYMLATQILTGSGGWPMSVFLTPQREPFYAGTYFPPADSYGRPGFPRLLAALAEAWRTREGELRGQAAEVVAAVSQVADEAAHSGGGRVDLAAWLPAAVEQYADRYDEQYGGLGSAPKFPPSPALLLWLEILKYHSTEPIDEKIPVAPGQEPPTAPPPPPLLDEARLAAVRQMLTGTLDGMARGGIFDQVGGGFARYSTDEKWLVPHFEKMLYDNAQLAPAYARAAVLLHRPDYARIARSILDFWLREMTSPEGAFYSSLDADSEEVEGKFYVWTLAEVRAAIPNADDANLVIKHFGITEEGNWHEGGQGANILFAARSVEDLAQEYGTTAEALQKRLDGLAMLLREARARRIGPGLDDKILTGWNGLMISALAVTGRLLHEPRYLEAAHRAVGFILLRHMAYGRELLRVSRAGKGAEKAPARAQIPAYLEDHAYLLGAVLDLIDSTFPTSLPGTMARKRVLELADALVREFHDTAAGGFFFTAAGHDQLFARFKNAADGATPSANAVAIRSLMRLSHVSGKENYRNLALQATGAFAGAVGRQPSQFATVLRGLLEDAAFIARNPHLALTPAAAAAPASGAGAEATAAGPAAPTTLRLDPVVLPPAKAGGTFEIALTLHIAEGYHIQLHTPEDREAFATVVRLRGDLALAGQEWQYPAAQEVPLGTTVGWGYQGMVVLRGRCLVAAGAAAGHYTLRATILAQPCTASSCLPPERATLAIPIEVIS